jgi:hypothetical protein
VTLRGTKRTTGTGACDSRRRGSGGRRGIFGAAIRLDEELESRTDDGCTTEVTQEAREAKEGSVRNIPGPSLSTGRTPNPIEEEGDLHNESFECGCTEWTTAATATADELRGIWMVSKIQKRTIWNKRGYYLNKPKNTFKTEGESKSSLIYKHEHIENNRRLVVVSS